MEKIAYIVDQCNNFVWSYILIGALLLIGVYFTYRTKFVQIRYIKEMFRLLGDSAGKNKKNSVSSFQAFCISIAARVGTGNLAGVATAIAIGGPAAVFWMWVVALIGAATGFIESTLAQVYKKHDGTTYIGGPAYYMQIGLKKRGMGILFAILLLVTYGLVFNSVQSNTISLAINNSFGTSKVIIGVLLTIATTVIIFGGIHRIAKVSSIIVPIMALLYIIVAMGIVIYKISELPRIMSDIFTHAFGIKEFIGGSLGAGIMQGVRRGLFSNEAGSGSTPNAAATAEVTHPAKQGLVQALGVFTDTLIICSCTAFLILVSDVPLGGEIKGIELTQMAISNQIGSWGADFVAVSIFLFAFSSIIGNYYYGEVNMKFITKNPKWITTYRFTSAAMVMFGAVASLNLVWNLADLTMAMLTITNLIAIVLLGKIAFKVLDDYTSQRRKGIKNPQFKASSIAEIKKGEAETWE